MIHIFNCSGESVGQIHDWKRLTVYRKLNAPAEVTLEMDHDPELFGLDYQVQLWRDYKELDCLYRSGSWSWDSQGQQTFTAKMFGLEQLLSRRTLLGGDEDYYDGSYSAEKCMKWTVRVQCGVGVPRELAQVGIPGLTVMASQDRGGNYSGYQLGTNLLEHLQKIATTLGMAFKVTSDTPMNFIFDAWPEPYGTDRTGTIIFSMQRGNVENITYSSIRDAEGTIAVGPSSLTEHYGIGYSDSPLNHWEVSFSPQTGQKPQEGALYALAQSKARYEVKATIMQTKSCAYGKDYFLGDWVSIVVPGRIFTQIITGVRWMVEYRGDAPVETIEIELTSGRGARNPLTETLQNLIRRIKYLELE